MSKTFYKELTAKKGKSYSVLIAFTENYNGLSREDLSLGNRIRVDCVESVTITDGILAIRHKPCAKYVIDYFRMKYIVDFEIKEE